MATWLIATGLMHVGRLFSGTPFLLFFGAIMVSAWYGGLGPGLLVTVLSMITGGVWFMPSTPVVVLSPAGMAMRAAVFGVEGAVISLLAEHMRGARRRAEQLQQEAGRARREAGDALERTREGALVQDELRARLAAIVEWSEDAIISLTPDGVVQTWNRGAEQLSGVPAAEAVGRPLMAFVPEGEQAGVEAALARARTGESVGPIEGERVRRDGSPYHLASIYSPLRGPDGAVVGISSVARDIGERRRAEQAVQQLNASLEQRVHARTAELEEANQKLAEANRQLEITNKELESFSYSVSHDLRAPVRALDGFSRIMLEDYASQIDEDGQRYLNLIRDNAQRMGALINDLLAFSRLSRQPLQKQRVDTARIAREAWQELSPEAQGRQVEVRIAELPPCDADPALIRQVFLNLLSNALKYTRKRDQVTIEVGSQGPPDEPVYFVRDNGVGFDMKYADKLFAVFQRLHRADEYEGTGVGLALAQRIVIRHGGRIWADAAPDQGATLFFTMGPCAP